MTTRPFSVHLAWRPSDVRTIVPEFTGSVLHGPYMMLVSDEEEVRRVHIFQFTLMNELMDKYGTILQEYLEALQSGEVLELALAEREEASR